MVTEWRFINGVEMGDKTEVEIEVRLSEKLLMEASAKTVQNMIGNCPNPTQVELRKLLAIQGTILNQLGIEMLIKNRDEKRGERKMQLGLKFLTASREALKSAGGLQGFQDSNGESHNSDENDRD